jgi:hypothetical protein
LQFPYGYSGLVYSLNSKFIAVLADSVMGGLDCCGWCWSCCTLWWAWNSSKARTVRFQVYHYFTISFQLTVNKSLSNPRSCFCRRIDPFLFLKGHIYFCSTADPAGKLPEETLDAISLKELFRKKASRKLSFLKCTYIFVLEECKSFYGANM